MSKDVVKTSFENMKDAASEAGHRVAAKAEEIKRDVGKGVMKPTENLHSVANQAKNEALAEVDRAKRDMRSAEGDKK